MDNPRPGTLDPNRRSPPDAGHGSDALAGPGLKDPVVRGLIPDGQLDELEEVGIGFSRPQRALDVGLAVGEKAAPQMAVGGQAEAIAAITEMVAQGADESDLPYGPLYLIPRCRAVQVAVLDPFQRAESFDPVTDLLNGNVSFRKKSYLTFFGLAVMLSFRSGSLGFCCLP